MILIAPPERVEREVCDACMPEHWKIGSREYFRNTAALCSLQTISRMPCIPKNVFLMSYE